VADIILKDIYKRFNDFTAVSNLNLEIQDRYRIQCRDYLQYEDGMIRALVEPHLKMKEGDEVSFSIDIQRSHIFDIKSGKALR